MKLTKKWVALLICFAMLAVLCVSVSAAGGKTNLSAELSAETAEIGDQITLTISNGDMNVRSIKAGFYFDNTKLQVNKITWSSIVAYSEEDDDDIDNGASSKTTKKKANEDGSALGVYAINNGADSDCYEGVIVTVIFDVIAEGDATITLREESVGTDAFKSDSAGTLTVTIGSTVPSCDHLNKTYTYETNSNGTHKVKCECGEYVNETEACNGTATCTAKAYCTKCETSYGELGDHTYGELIAAQEAVHTKDELKGAVAAHYLCACGKYFTEGKAETTLEALTGDAPVHTYNNGNKGTLVNAGDCVTKATYKAMCDNCTFEHETNTVEGALGDHTYGQLIEATGAVHTQTELKGAVAAHYLCACGKYFTEGKAETTLETLTGEAPVHAHAGYDKTATQHTSICSCGKEMGTAEDHNWADGKCSVCNYECQHEDKTAGFQPTGNNTHTKYNTCNTCGATNLDKEEGVKCTDKDNDGNHTCDFCTNTAAVTDCSGGSATCTAKAICTECDEEYGNLAEHTYNNGLKGTLVNAGDCQTKATYKAKCDNCDFEHDTNTVEGELGDHTYGQLIEATGAVHTKDELKGAVDAHYLCACGKYFTEGKVETTLDELTGEAPEHTYDEGRQGTLVNAGDCQTKATYAAKCDNCDFEHDTNTVEGALGGHTYGQLIEATEAVHTKDELKAGVAAHYLCACGKYFTEGKVETTLDELTGDAPVHAHDHYDKTATQHQSICSCGEILATEDCSFGATHETACKCGNTYTGWAVEVDGETGLFESTIYVENGQRVRGWKQIGEDWYYLSHTSGFRAEGLYRAPYPTEAINGVTYAPNAEDLAYYNANKDTSKYTDATTAVFIFGEDGKFDQTWTGFITDGDVQRYAVNGMIPWHVGFVSYTVSGETRYNYFSGDTSEAKGGNVRATGKVYATRDYNANKPVDGAIYMFDENGRLIKNVGIVDGYYYNEDNSLAIGAGLVAHGDGYIYVRSNGQVVTDAKYWLSASKLEAAGITDYKAGMYSFDENGMLILPEIEPELNGIVEKDGEYYYYVDGVKQAGAGVVKMSDENGTFYIYVTSDGTLATGKYWPTNLNGLLDSGCYDWGTDGKYYPTAN